MTNYDITGKIGPLFSSAGANPVEWPMYSYDRPAYLLWNAIASGLNKRGWSDKQIKDWLQSKGPRWSLDGDLGEILQSVGEIYAKSCDHVA